MTEAPITDGPRLELPPAHYRDPRVELYKGEALHVLAALPSSSVDALVTDPPYSSGGQFRGDRTGGTGAKYVQTGSGSHDLPDFSGDSRDARSYGYWCALWLSEAARVVVEGGIVALFTDWRQLPTTTDALQAGGMIWRGIVPWHKPGGRRTQGRWANDCEFVVWGTNGARSLDYLGDCAFPGFYQANAPRDREHQTQKPVEVLRGLLQVVPVDGVVLDPFMGSGTTGVAAVIENRRFVGIEKVPHYVDVAERRIREAALQPVPRGDQTALDLTGGGPC